MSSQRKENSPDDAKKAIDVAYWEARRYVHDHHEAEDVTMETMAAALKGFDPAMGSLSTRAYRIAQFKAIEAYRKRKRERARRAPSTLLETVSDDDRDESGVAEVVGIVRRAIWRLPDNLRDVIVRYYIQGQSTGEISADLDLTRGAVRKRLFDARRLLWRDEELRGIASVLFGF